MEKISVLLTTEGTYPYYMGGVSTWCHELIGNMPEIDYSLISIIDSPAAEQRFCLSKNVTDFITIPLWGTKEPSEHLKWVPFSEIFLMKLKTNKEVITEEFIPLFLKLIEEIFSIQKNPKIFGEVLLTMYAFFKRHDYHNTLKSEVVYNLYKDKITKAVRNKKYFFYKNNIMPTIGEVEESLGWIFRFFNIINTYVPKTDITHSSAAGFCGIPNVISKLLYQTPYILTEHGIYMREQYLCMQEKKMSLFLKTFFLCLTESVVRLNYEYADIVCPVCGHNSRWEKVFGVNEDRIRVIYNGVNPKKFTVRQREEKNTIIAVARIDPLKDIENFIMAAYHISRAIPEINFAVYGAVSNKEYYKRCIKLKDSLGLKEKLKICGHVENPQEIYDSGDIVVLPSISEAFPYSIIEAMMCGKPVVATEVGGVEEAVHNCGIIVPPRNSKKLAEACIDLAKDKKRRKEMGESARKRAIDNFTINKFTKAYLKVYKELKNRGCAYEQ